MSCPFDNLFVRSDNQFRKLCRNGQDNPFRKFCQTDKKSEKWMFDQFLKAGITIAGVDVGESYGSPKGS